MLLYAEPEVQAESEKWIDCCENCSKKIPYTSYEKAAQARVANAQRNAFESMTPANRAALKEAAGTGGKRRSVRKGTRRSSKSKKNHQTRRH